MPVELKGTRDEAIKILKDAKKRIKVAWVKNSWGDSNAACLMGTLGLAAGGYATSTDAISALNQNRCLLKAFQKALDTDGEAAHVMSSGIQFNDGSMTDRGDVVKKLDQMIKFLQPRKEKEVRRGTSRTA
jgi:hypothetical protein